MAHRHLCIRSPFSCGRVFIIQPVFTGKLIASFFNPQIQRIAVSYCPRYLLSPVRTVEFIKPFKLHSGGQPVFDFIDAERFFITFVINGDPVENIISFSDSESRFVFRQSCSAAKNRIIPFGALHIDMAPFFFQLPGDRVYLFINRGLLDILVNCN